VSAKVHDLKTAWEPFHSVVDGCKRFEYRRNDRDFKVGDYLMLREREGFGDAPGRETCLVKVTYILRGEDLESFGVPEGYCVMSIERVYP
jgi:ParB family chromosome partitioning protein